MNDVTNLLEDARSRTADPARWTQGALARDGAGISCNYPGSGDPVCWCALGSLYRSVETLYANRKTHLAANLEMVVAALRLYQRTIAKVNDDLGHEATLKMFDDAIAHSKLPDE